MTSPSFDEFVQAQASLHARLDRARGIRTQSENPSGPRAFDPLPARSEATRSRRKKSKTARASRRANRNRRS